MQPTTRKSNVKAIATVLATVVLAVSGLMVLFSTKATPESHGPIITADQRYR